MLTERFNFTLSENVLMLIIWLCLKSDFCFSIITSLRTFSDIYITVTYKV